MTLVVVPKMASISGDRIFDNTCTYFVFEVLSPVKFVLISTGFPTLSNINNYFTVSICMSQVIL